MKGTPSMEWHSSNVKQNNTLINLKKSNDNLTIYKNKCSVTLNITRALKKPGITK